MCHDGREALRVEVRTLRWGPQSLRRRFKGNRKKRCRDRHVNISIVLGFLNVLLETTHLMFLMFFWTNKASSKACVLAGVGCNWDMVRFPGGRSEASASLSLLINTLLYVYFDLIIIIMRLFCGFCLILGRMYFLFDYIIILGFSKANASHSYVVSLEDAMS